MRVSYPSARLACLCAAAALLGACGGASSIKPAEVLDESSGMTIGTLDKPVEMLQAVGMPAVGMPAVGMPATTDRRASFAYLGPVEWDNMGVITYGLWIHIAPGNDWRFADIQAPGAVRLRLDDATSVLAAFKPPASGSTAYRAVASWGDTAYFLVDLQLLKRMASSTRIGLDVGTLNDSVVHFAAPPDTPETLTRYLHARGY